MFGIEIDYSIPTWEEIEPWLFPTALLGFTLGAGIGIAVMMLV